MKPSVGRIIHTRFLSTNALAAAIITSVLEDVPDPINGAPVVIPRVSIFQPDGTIDSFENVNLYDAESDAQAAKDDTGFFWPSRN